MNLAKVGKIMYLYSHAQYRDSQECTVCTISNKSIAGVINMIRNSVNNVD